EDHYRRCSIPLEGMLLRILTSFFLIFGIVLTLGFPWVIRARPVQPTHADLQQDSVLFGTYLIVTMLSFVGAAICAILMVRKVRESFREASRQNLEDLVESALRQHQKSGKQDE